MKYYFHGTDKNSLKSIIKNGFSVKYGRATFTTNPLYTASFSSSKTWGTKKKTDIKPIIEEGRLLVFKDTKNKIKLAKDSFIILKKKEKILAGWTNRYKTEQFGYFAKGKIPTKDIIAAFSYSEEFLKLLKQINKEIISGKINEKYIKQKSKNLEKILVKIQIINSKIPIREIASSIIYGMIRNQVLREIRTCYLSNFALNGWKVINYGTHPVKLKNKQEIKKSLNNLKRIINKKFISQEIKKEYLRLLK